MQFNKPSNECSETAVENKSPEWAAGMIEEWKKNDPSFTSDDLKSFVADYAAEQIDKGASAEECDALVRHILEKAGISSPDSSCRPEDKPGQSPAAADDIANDPQDNGEQSDLNPAKLRYKQAFEQAQKAYDDASSETYSQLSEDAPDYTEDQRTLLADKAGKSAYDKVMQEYRTNEQRLNANKEYTDLIDEYAKLYADENRAAEIIEPNSVDAEKQGT